MLGARMKKEERMSLLDKCIQQTIALQEEEERKKEEVVSTFINNIIAVIDSDFKAALRNPSSSGKYERVYGPSNFKDIWINIHPDVVAKRVAPFFESIYGSALNENYDGCYIKKGNIEYIYVYLGWHEAVKKKRARKREEAEENGKAFKRVGLPVAPDSNKPLSKGAALAAKIISSSKKRKISKIFRSLYRSKNQ